MTQSNDRHSQTDLMNHKSSVPFSSQLNAVAICRTPYKQKFGIPRQPGLVNAVGYIEFEPAFNHIDAVRGIEQYSHLWLLFCFHENLAQGWKTTVRPPRLGGNEKLGVFATRSTFRPNGIGQSVVKLHGVIQRKGKVCLVISGMDLLDGTPIVDIKPYIPFSDAIFRRQRRHSPRSPNPHPTDLYIVSDRANRSLQPTRAVPRFSRAY